MTQEEKNRWLTDDGLLSVKIKIQEKLFNKRVRYRLNIAGIGRKELLKAKRHELPNGSRF